MRDLGLDATWEVVNGEATFYQCTKAFHNGLQGTPVVLTESLLKGYEETSVRNAERLAPVLADADFVFIHDPQPARLLHLVPPSIDPLSDKNCELPEEEIQATRECRGLPGPSPIALQVSRFDRFKDPLGVIRAYRLAKRRVPDLRLVLAGGGATDDPEGEAVLREVRDAAVDDPDIHVLLLPGDAHREINALQRVADVVLQKSLREGFGLTVTEAMWKGKPVIGGATGGIRLQVADGYTGFLVSSPEGAALRLLHLLHRDRMREAMGRRGRDFVRENFLLTRHLRDYLSRSTERSRWSRSSCPAGSTSGSTRS